VCLEARRHGVVLVGPLVRAFVAAGLGAFLLTLPWPVPVLGAALVGVGAVLGVVAVWRWDRTRLVVTTEKVVRGEGVLRRHESTVLLRTLDGVRLERSLPGRLLGYGTIVVGPVRVSHVTHPRQVTALLEQVSRHAGAA